MTYLGLAEHIIKTDEGWQARAYRCTEGWLTIGWGRRIDDSEKHTVTTKEKESQWVVNRISKLDKELSKSISCFKTLSEVRRAVLISLAYQLGVNGLMAFKRFLEALNKGDYLKASVELLDSKYARQTANRANRNANMIALGKLDKYYGDV